MCSEICVPYPVLTFCPRKEVILFTWALPAKTWRVLELCTPPIDDTPPITGVVDVKWLPFEVLSITWDKFEEPESQIAFYSYCIGSSPGDCKYQDWTDVGRSLSATLLDIYGTTGDPLYVVVRCTNSQGLTSAVVVASEFSAGPSSFDHISIRHPVSDDFVAVGYYQDDPFYVNATKIEVELQLLDVQPGVNITMLEWGLSTLPAVSDLVSPADNGVSPTGAPQWQPVGRFTQLAEDPASPMQLGIDMNTFNMTANTTWYLAIRCGNSLNQQATFVVPITYDTETPLPQSAAIVETSATGWSIAPSSLALCWDFDFPQAPVYHFQVQVHDNITGPIRPPGDATSFVVATTASNCTVVPKLPLQDGRYYFANITAVSNSGHIVSTVSDPAPVDASLALCKAGFTANQPVQTPLVPLYPPGDDAFILTPRTYVPSVEAFSFTVGCEDPHSGILDFAYAITINGTYISTNTSSNSGLVLPFRSFDGVVNDIHELVNASVADDDSLLQSPLPIHEWLHGVVRATNGANQVASGYCGSVMIDNTPPTLNSSNIAIIDGTATARVSLPQLVYQQSRSVLQADFTDAFADAESGIVRYWLNYKLQDTELSSATAEAILGGAAGWEESTLVATTATTYNFTDLTLTDGNIVVIGVVAENGAGLLTPAVTPRIMVDGSPPTAFDTWIEDKFTIDCLECLVFQKSERQLTAYWGPQKLNDPQSTLLAIELVLVRVPNRTAAGNQGTDVEGSTLVLNDVGRTKWIIKPETGSLRQGQHYRVRVTAINKALGRREQYTNVLTVDTSPPAVTTISDNTGNANRQEIVDPITGVAQVFVTAAEEYQIEMNAEDAESPVFAWIVSMGTSPGDTDVMRQTALCAGTDNSSSCGDYPDCTPLDAGCAAGLKTETVKETRVLLFQRRFVYTTVEAVNQAGVSSIATTGGRLIDPDNPTIAAVLDGWGRDAQYVGTDDGFLYVSWVGVTDNTTAIHKRSYAITESPQPPLDPADYTEVPADVTGTRLAVQMTLRQGVRYYMHLRVEDKATNWAVGSSSGALVDLCSPVVSAINHVRENQGLAFQNTTRGTVAAQMLRMLC